MKKLIPFAAISTLAFLSPAKALDFDFSGTFSKDNDVVALSFTVGAPSTVTVFSSSWDDGGFDPILTIWTGAGSMVYQQDDGGNVGSTLSNGTLYDHGTWDSYYAVSLGAGTYIATIAQYDNFASGTLSPAAFTFNSSPHFTFTNGYGPQPDFNGVDGVGRTGDWVFHILNVERAQQGVPDATSTIALMGMAMMAFVGLKRKIA